MADFMEILNKKAAEVEKPKPRPAGTYLGVVQGMPEQRTVKDNNILSFNIKLVMPREDVDQEKLAEQPPINEWRAEKHDIFVSNEAGVYQLKQFLTESLGIDPGTEDNPKTLGEMCAEAPGRQVLVTMKHEPYMDKDNQPQIASRIRGTAKV